MTRLLALLLLAALTAPALSQTIEKIPEVVIERELALDDEGLKQFVPFDVACPPCKGRGVDTCRGCAGVELPGCQECDGEKTATCRVCVGEKKLPDPIEALVCPSCWGSGWTDCGSCGGFGQIRESDPSGNETMVRCVACKAKGRWECVVCEGEQHLPSIRVKKKAPTRAKLKDLLKAQESLAEALAYLDGFEPTERASKVLKAMTKDLRGPSKTLPELGKMIETLDAVLDGIHKSSAQYVNYEARLTHRILTYRNRMLYLLRYQSRVLELCIERAEYNESVKAPR